jgi:hypothetical protein
MTVIAFPHIESRAGSVWGAGELEQILRAVTPKRSGSCAGRWDVGATEMGDPQFYLIGPPPHEECILCISRLGRNYVLEDGAGRILFEHNSLIVLAERARARLQKRKSQIVARLAVLGCALRAAFEEKIEPIVGESEELLTHVVPQLAALA